MHALLNTEKNETRVGSPVEARGEEGGRSWKDTAQLSEERRRGKDREGKPLKPTKSLYFPLQDGGCRSSASLLGKKTRTTEGYSRGGGTTGWLASPAPA